jgi:signal transduction histidine kinase
VFANVVAYMASPAVHQAVTEPAEHLAPVPVLVVADELVPRARLTACLPAIGAHVSCARSTAQALELLLPERPALLVVALLREDALASLAHLRLRRELSDAPVLVLLPDTEAVQRAYEAGASDVIPLQLPDELLLLKLRAWLRIGERMGRLRALRDFAHEVRNPLASMDAAGRRIALEHIDIEQRRLLGQAISSEAERLGRLVQRYVYGNKLLGGDLCTQNPAGLLRELLALTLGDRASRVRFELPSDLPALRVNPDALRQMLINLIDNALTATAEGGEVTIAAHVDEVSVSIAVRDTGHGIPADVLPRIFEDGFTTSGDSWRGLGLGLTRRLCARAGGRLGVKSIPGKGSEFTLVLPRAPS